MDSKGAAQRRQETYGTPPIDQLPPAIGTSAASPKLGSLPVSFGSSSSLNIKARRGSRTPLIGSPTHPPSGAVNMISSQPAPTVVNREQHLSKSAPRLNGLDMAYLHHKFLHENGGRRSSGVSGQTDEDDDDDDEEEEEEEEEEAGTAIAIHKWPSIIFGRDVAVDIRDTELVFDRARQRLYLEEEDLEIDIIGYQNNRFKLLLYYVGCVLSGGMLYLLLRWLPLYQVQWIGIECSLEHADWVVIKNQLGEISIEPILRRYYPGSIGSVFAPSQMPRLLDDLNLAPPSQIPAPTEPLSALHILDYRYVRMIYHPILHRFVTNGWWRDELWNSIKGLKRGLNRDVVAEREILFGENLINIKEKSTFKLLVDEVLNPFYVFQIFSMLLWCLDDYYYYAFCIFVISVTGVVTTLIETKQTMARMSKMSRFECPVNVRRGNFWRQVRSTALVPGDIIELSDTQLHTLPCDALLLTGDCILNESMLTGESIPVSKSPITEAALKRLDLHAANIPSDVSKHFLFCGTKIVRVRCPHGGMKGDVTAMRSAGVGVGGLEMGGDPEQAMALAVVVRTGFNTSKGALVRSMLFPKPNKFQFYRDSFRFIGVLACVAVLGFLISAVNFLRMGIDPITIIKRALDLVTIVVPPALPATMSIGTSFAIARLKAKDIFCISPPRVNIGGKIDCMCFDKTGTLTEDGLDVLAVRGIDLHSHRFGEESRVIEDLNGTIPTNEGGSLSTLDFELRDNVRVEQARINAHLLHAITTCHSLKHVEEELIGDPLDLKMFEFSQWELEESSADNPIGLNMTTALGVGKSKMKGGLVPTLVRPPGGQKFCVDLDPSTGMYMKPATPLELGIVHSFEFVSSLRRMAVIVRRLGRPNLDVYVKGAPEAIGGICRPETLPINYREQLYWYTHRGYRVIALAHKDLGNLKWHKMAKLKRPEVESALTFLGFIIFENKLKEGTIPAVDKLRAATIRQVMCTGDNVLTAISVSRECGLVNHDAEIYAPRFVIGEASVKDSCVVWESVVTEGQTLDAEALVPIDQNGWSSADHGSIGASPYYAKSQKYELAVTGEVFRWMVDFATQETLNRMLVKAQIFARMSPDEKQELVDHLQNIGYCVGFCGDGANDCGALKGGDVGISLSEAEASVAAPFTSKTMDIGCVLNVIREGRAALVTSFSCFKYMALYSIIQFTSVTLLYALASNLGDFQFLYIDLIIILPIAVFMGRTEAYPHLNRKRPTARLMSKKVLTSLLGNIFINSTMQIFLFWFVRQQGFYTPPSPHDAEDVNIACYENTVLFLFSCFQYIIVAVVFSVGPPYRKQMWTNAPFVITSCLLVAVTGWITLFPNDVFRSWLELELLPYSFRVFLIILGIVNLALCWIAEKYVFPHLAQHISTLPSTFYSLLLKNRGYTPVDRKKKQSSKLFKRILNDMHA